MPAHVHVGCCGWSYMRETEFHELDGVKRVSKLDSYARLFPSVEINSSYYAIPREATAIKWRHEADAVNPKFEFTLKMYKGITHNARFGGVAKSFYDSTWPIIPELRAHLLLFQSPATFAPTEKNIQHMRAFFSEIERRGIVCTWEPRGAWYDEPSLIDQVCNECRLVQCVDPFRNTQTTFQHRTAYYRLHGFGKPTMYNYDFSDRELQTVYDLVVSQADQLDDIYVMFNNRTCYRNGTQFLEMLQETVPALIS